MPAATVTATVTDIRYTTAGIGNWYIAIVNLSIGANPLTYTSGGIVCSLSLPLIKSQRPPIFQDISSLNGWQYYYVPGTNISNGLLKIFTADGTELGNGVAIPAGNSGDTITAQFTFIGQN